MNDFRLRETKIHGTVDFPYIVYHGKIPEFIRAFPQHWHDEMELIYVASGQIKISVWADTYCVCAGDIVIVLPHSIHAIEQISTKRAEYYNIVFHFSILGDDPCSEKYLTPFLKHEKSLKSYEPSGSQLNELLKPFVLSLIENRRQSYTTHEYLVKSNLFMIMHLLNQYCILAPDNDMAHQVSYNKLKTVLYHVQNSYGQDISVTKAAALCGFSESHFMRLFKELMGTSFTAYLINYRLELAASQIVETDLNIIEIAANCGFHNHSYFTRLFTKKYGITPIKYRNSHRYE